MSEQLFSGQEGLPPKDAAMAMRQRLVDQLRTDGALHDPEVEHAISVVPRHRFLPGLPLEQSYADTAVSTRFEREVPISAASQPGIVALMLEQARVEPGMRVLEIGAGTGYNAALLAELVGPTGQVVTVDIDEDITRDASAHLASAGYPEVVVETGDGAAGWPALAPYDRIELTVGAPDISPTWFSQLRDGGLLVLPLQLGLGDLSVAFRKHGEMLLSESVVPCGFMSLRGGSAGPSRWATLPNGWRLASTRAEAIAPTVYQLLTTRPRRRLNARPLPMLMQHLGLVEPDAITLWPNPIRVLRTKTHETDGRNALSNGRVPATRPRYGIYREGPDGPSLALYSPHLPVALTFGGTAASDTLEALEQLARAGRLRPPASWQIAAYPRTSTALPPAPTEPGTLRIARSAFVYDVVYAG